MIKIDQIKVPVSSEVDLKQVVCKKYNILEKDIISFSIYKRSVDARKKPDLFFVYSIILDLGAKEQGLLNRYKKDNNINSFFVKEINYNRLSICLNKRPLIIGAGPAGLFCAYVLASSGLNPIIFERGKSVEDRALDIARFWDTGVLDVNSNVQFGEGGAGTFSDGKLNTLVNDKQGRNRFVLETFVKFGAPENILYDAKPHIGTDILISVIGAMREAIKALGGEFYFSSQVTDFKIIDNRVAGIYVGEQFFEADDVVLAIGHSARDTFFKLHDLGIKMEAKDFAVGFRIEHPQSMISYSQYGENNNLLPAANYKLATNLANGRGVYSFCMCPGGFVVNSSSEKERLVVNGMSYSKRDSKNANSAIVVSVGANEFDKTNPLSAIAYQRSIEQKAFELCNGAVQQQLLTDFKRNKLSTGFGDFTSEVKGKSAFGLVSEILSKELNNSIIEALEVFGKKIKGFDRDDAILSGVESRTSSPVRINRDELFYSNVNGLYPCGEGAGFAGGITSAAMDGIKVAEAIISKYN